MRFLTVFTKPTAIHSEIKLIKPKLFNKKNQTHTNNIRATWKQTNSIPVKIRKNLYDLSINQNYTLITDDLQLTSLFNKYFSQIGFEFRQQIPKKW